MIPDPFRRQPSVGIMDEAGATQDPSLGVLAQYLAPKPQGKPKALGVILDIIAGLGGHKPAYAMHRQEQAQLAERDRRSIMAQQLEDLQWRQREEYKRANPAPAQPGAIERNYQFFQGLNPALAKQYAESVASGPPMAIDQDDGNGNVYRSYVPRSQLTAPAPVAPQKPVGKLTPMGGAGRSGPRTFR